MHLRQEQMKSDFQNSSTWEVKPLTDMSFLHLQLQPRKFQISSSALFCARWHSCVPRLQKWPIFKLPSPLRVFSGDDVKRNGHVMTILLFRPKWRTVVDSLHQIYISSLHQISWTRNHQESENTGNRGKRLSVVTYPRGTRRRAGFK